MAPKKYNVKGDLVAGKERFLKVFNKIYRQELAASPTGELTNKEISRLRNHPDLGFWSSNGKPISIESVNAHIRWLNSDPAHRKKTSPLIFKEVKPQVTKGYTRGFLESQDSITREAKRWIKRLNDTRTKDNPQGLWPPGVTEKTILRDIAKAAEETGAENLKLKEQTGIDFQKGHGWGVMGPGNKRTWVVPYFGARMEGHFNFRNVAPQPTKPTLAQLLHPFWNAIIPNVPSQYSKHGVQISSAEDLRWAGGGGQGWSGTIADILLSKIPNANIDDFDKLPLDQKAYVLFGDPDKGAGVTPESRYFQIKNNEWPTILKTLAEGAETAEAKSGKVKILTKGTRPWFKAWDQIIKKQSDSYNKIKNSTSTFLSELFPSTEGDSIKVQGDGTAVLADEAVLPRKVNLNKLADLGNTNVAKGLTSNFGSAVSGPGLATNVALNPKLMQQIGARIHKGEPIDWKGFGAEVGKDIAWDTVFGGLTYQALKKAGPLGSYFITKSVFDAADAYVEGATGTSIRDRDAQRRKDQAAFSDKRIRESGLVPIHIDSDVTPEIKQYTPSLLEKAQIKAQQLLN